MFQRILVANRGEIALRIIRACRELGIESVAVFSEADRGAHYLSLADEAYCIGPAPAVDSYLMINRIISAAEIGNVQAIHPGYGFLSENAHFAEVCRDCKIEFIGPSHQAMSQLGDKVSARQLAMEAKVPTVPGSEGLISSEAAAVKLANEIGYPVLIKATAGGGGKGMRVANNEMTLKAGLKQAALEAENAFKNGGVYLEKYIEHPRHIEVQVFGDGTRAVHLYERDCSLQRRHQKVIEEAPAPGMTAEMRAAMGQAAVRAAEAIGYSGAGTVEFIVDASDGLRPDRFWFMEMNTRLQVEHPVTEAVTGIDLVEWQLRVASGEPLPATQDEIRLTGHAFEARLYAEDVPAGFLPATGTLSHLKFPEGARAETGVRPGDTISPWYDPMIAKIIVHGPTRAIALRQLSAALDATEVAGSVTNLAFLAALSRHEGFAAGDVDTGLIARDLDALTDVAPADMTVKALAALGAAGLADRGGALAGFTLWQPLRRTVPLEGVEAVVEVMAPDRARVSIAGETAECFLRGGQWWGDGHPSGARIVVTPGLVSIFGRGAHHFHLVDPLDREADAAGGGLTLSPMPGLVKAVFAKAGQRVKAGDRLAVLEAMKMEHTLTAARDGIVAEVLVAAGAQVEAGAALVRLEEEA